MHVRESGMSLLELVTGLALAGIVVLFAGSFMTSALRNDSAQRARVAAGEEAREMGRRLGAMVERTSDRGGEYVMRAKPGCRAPCELLRGETARGAWSLEVRCLEDKGNAKDVARKLSAVLRCEAARCAEGKSPVLVLTRPGRATTVLPAAGALRAPGAGASLRAASAGAGTLRAASACVRRAGDEWIVSLAAASADAAAGREVLLPARRIGAAAGIDVPERDLGAAAGITVPAWVQSSY